MSVFICQGFQGAAGSRSHADNPTAFGLRFVEQCRRFMGNHAKFAVHMVIVYIVHLHGAEGSQSNMERHICQFYALFFDFFQQFLGKMQTRRRSGGRTVDLGIDRLIAFSVCQFFLDVRGQRHFAQTLQLLQENALVVEFHQAVARFRLTNDGRRQCTVTKNDLRTGVELASGLRQALPHIPFLLGE